MTIKFDSSQVDTLAVDFSEAPARMQRRAPQILLKHTRELQRAMTRDASGHRYLPRFSNEIGLSRIDALSYEVGFNKAGQGKLANIIVFGSINNAPVYDFYAPLRAQEPLVLRDLANGAEGSALGTGSEDR